MKITIDHEDGTPPRVWGGDAAETLAKAMQILWENYLRQEDIEKEAFNDLMKALRK